MTIANPYNTSISETVDTVFTAAAAFVPPRGDPLVLDLDGDGIESVGINATNPVMFDIDATGVQVSVGWLLPDDGFLTLDRNGNGTIDSGAELFGDATPLAGGGQAADGFAALAQEDSNSDGKIDAQDTHWSNLRVWRDLNQDGISQSGELITLNEAGVAAINLTTEAAATVLANGNRISKVGSYVRTDGSTASWGEDYEASDIDLVEDTFHSEFTDSIPLTTATEALPAMQGSGMVRNLREAATLSTTLQGLLEQFSAATERADQIALMDGIVKAWSDTSTMATTFTGAYAEHSSVTTRFDGGSATDLAWREKITILEHFIGHTLRVVPAGTGPVSVTIHDGTMALLQKDYDLLKTSVYQALALQTRLKPLLDEVQISLTELGAVLDLSAVEADLNARIAANPAKGIADLLDFTLSTKSEFMNAQWDGWQLLSDTQIAQLMTPELLATLGWQGIMVKGQAGYLPLGTGYDDVIIGDNGADNLNGKIGSDILIGSGGTDNLTGESGNDLLVGGAGNDGLYGGTGNDTYVFWTGAGQDRIFDSDTTSDNVDTIRLQGLTPDQVSLARSYDSNGNVSADLVLKVNGTTDQLTIVNYFTYTDGRNKIEQVVFDDGTIWTPAELDTAAFDLRPASNDFIYRGASYPNASDFYVFSIGAGQDEILDIDSTPGNIDTVKLAGVLPSQVNLTRTYDVSGFPANLLISIIGTTDTLKIKNYFSGTSNRIEQIMFDDGTLWSTSALNAAAIMPVVAGSFNGTANADVFDLRNAASNTVFGNTSGSYDSGDDTYFFAAGSGQDVLQDYGTSSGNIDTVKVTGLTPSQVSLTRGFNASGYTNDLVIQVNGTQEKLTIQNYFSGDAYKVEKVQFDDGTVWTAAEMDVAPFDFRTAINNTVNRGGAYANANDTYLFAAGAGQDVINDYDPAAGNIDTLKVIGASPSQVSLQRPLTGSSDLVVSINATGDTLTVKNYFSSSGYKIEKIQFDDGTIWTTSQLDLAALTPTVAGTVSGTPGADVFDVRNAVSNTVYGYTSGLSDSGNDTYVFGIGAGLDTIQDYGTAAGNLDTIRVVGLAPSQVTLAREADTNSSFNLLLKINGTADQLKVIGHMNGTANAIERVVFDDGTIWDSSVINSAPITPTSAGGVGYGSTGGDNFDLRSATNNTVYGYNNLGYDSGNDTYVFGAGAGQDVLQDYGTAVGNVDTIKLVGLTPSQITLTRDFNSGYPNDLAILINGTSDRLTVRNYFSATAYKIEKIVFDDGTILTPSEFDVAPFDFRGSGNNTASRGGANPNANDTYLFAAGAGQDVISDNDVTAGNIDTVKILGKLPSEVSVSRSLSGQSISNDLVISLNASTDKLTIQNYFSGTAYKIEKLQFDDGTIWTSAEFEQAAMTPATAGIVYGTAISDIYDLRTGVNNTVYGYNTSGSDSGNDTYLFGVGAGQDAVQDYGTAAGNIDTIKIKGVATSQINLTREADASGSNHLLIKINGTGDQLKVLNYFNGTAYAIERIAFDDGTIWDSSVITVAPITPTVTGTVYGTSAADYFDLRGAVGNTLYGFNTSASNSGDDTYIFGTGGGQDTIQDYGTGTNLDTIRVAGLSSSQVSLTREADGSGSYHLLLKAVGTSDQLKVLNQFNSASYAIERIVFDDGTTWNGSVINTAPITPTSINTGGVLGSISADVFDLRSSSNNTVYGYTTTAANSGDDLYLFGPGAGQDIIQDYSTASGNTDLLKFDSGIAPGQVWLRHVGNNLEVSRIGTTDKVTIQNWYAGSAYHIEQFKTADNKTLLDSNVESLVQAMAALSPPVLGQTTLPQNYQDALGTLIASYWV